MKRCDKSTFKRGLLPLALPALLASLPAPSAAEAGGDLTALGKRLTAAGKRTSTLRADFVQRKRLRLFKTEVTTRGRIAYQRPDRLRWETLPPDASLLLVRGQRAELRLPSEAPRVIDLRRNRTMGILVQQLLVCLGARPVGELTRWYSVAVTPGKGGATRLRLVPKDSGLRKRGAAVAITLGPDLAIRTVEVTQRGGDTTLITFDKVRRNAKLGQGTFQ